MTRKAARRIAKSLRHRQRKTGKYCGLTVGPEGLDGGYVRRHIRNGEERRIVHERLYWGTP